MLSNLDARFTLNMQTKILDSLFFLNSDDNNNNNNNPNISFHSPI
jgi:hypothetical protein